MKKIFIACAFLFGFAANSFATQCDASYLNKIQLQQGGEVLAVCSGGSIIADTGATITLPSGSVAPASIPLAVGKMLLGNASGVAAAQMPTGVIAISSSGAITHVAGSIVNADINASAAIVDTKLAQITTANKVATSAIAAGNIAAATKASAVVIDAAPNANIVPTVVGQIAINTTSFDLCFSTAATAGAWVIAKSTETPCPN